MIKKRIEIKHEIFPQNSLQNPAEKCLFVIVLLSEFILVKRLQEAAVQWPFSSPGMPVDVETGIDIISSNDCLCQTYIDRIIVTRDIKRSKNEQVKEKIREALGDHHAVLWPGFEPLIKES